MNWRVSLMTVGLLAPAFCIWWTYPHWSMHLLPEVVGTSTEQNPRSPFDGAEALFAGLAFVGLIVSIWQQQKQLKLQSDELALQRQELEDTRKVLIEQRAEMSAQVAAMRKQTIESLIVSIIRIHDDLLENLSPRGNSSIIAELEWHYNKLGREFADKTTSVTILDKGEVAVVYTSYLRSKENDLAPVLHLLCHLIVSIGESGLSNDEKKQYLTVVACKLTYAESCLLFYHLALWIPDSESGRAFLSKARDVTQSLGLFAFLAPSRLHYSDHRNWLDKAAWG